MKKGLEQVIEDLDNAVYEINDLMIGLENSRATFSSYYQNLRSKKDEINEIKKALSVYR